MLHAARLTAGAGLAALLLVASGPVTAQPPAPAAKKVLTFADESIWRTASQPVISPDGTHVAYSVSPVEGDGESVVRNVATGKDYTFPRGAGVATGNPKFTPDGKFVLLPLTPTKAETDKAKADKVKTEEMPQTTLAVVELATGKATDRFPQAGVFAVGGEGAGFVVYRKPLKTDPAKDDGKSPPVTIPTKGKGGGKFGNPKGEATGAANAPPGAIYGSDLIVRDLATKHERTIPDVMEFSLSRDGKLLVYAVSSRKDETNGVYAINPAAGLSTDMLKGGPGRYSGLTWDEKQAKLAFLYDDSMVADPKIAPPPRPVGTPLSATAPLPTANPPTTQAKYRAYVWDRNAKAPQAAAPRFPVLNTGGFAGMVPVVLAANTSSRAAAIEVLGPNSPGLKPGWTLGGGSLGFSQDGTKLFVNTAPKRAPAPTVGPPRQDDFQMELWHWKDERLQPMQKLQAEADRAKTYSGVVLLDTKQFRQLSDETVTVDRPQGESEWTLGADDRKYRHVTGYGLLRSDFTAVNVRTGERKPLLTGYGSYSSPRPNVSPTGTHAVAFDGKDWFTVSVTDGKKTVLTANLKVKFIDEEDDHPGTPPPAGSAQWTADGKFVLVNDRYDVWKLAADGSSVENLTKVGRSQHVRFTLLNVQSPDDPKPFHGYDLSKPVLLAALNRQTHDSGFYRLDPGAAPKLLVMGARKYGTPTKAKDAETYLFTAETFATAQDYYVATASFIDVKRVTDINPRVKDFNWGKAELVHYTSTDGTPLSGVLVKPENFDPSKKYPMVVYIYERLSDTVHNFRPPVVRGGQVINPTFYASNGYLVLMPDIAYKVGAPGQSAMKCVLPAIQTVVDKGFVDEKAIGINGQSWGGYQIAYMVTQTDRFKAAVAGAAVSNMVSAYDGIRWGSGLTRQHQYEWTQSRIGATLWDAPMKFIENSPVFMADRVKTPLLMINNDADDAVPWYQGIEMYLALRRLERECYMLNYNGQPHNLTNRAAARDFAARMYQFFEHHLRGRPEPAWMAKGVPFLDREKDKEEIKKLLGPDKK